MLVVFRSFQVNCGNRKLKQLRKEVIQFKAESKKLEWESKNFHQELLKEKEKNARQLKNEVDRPGEIDNKEKFMSEFFS